MSYSLKLLTGTLLFYLLIFVVFEISGIPLDGDIKIGTSSSGFGELEPIDDIQAVESSEGGFFSAIWDLMVLSWDLLVFMFEMTFTITGLPWWADMLMKIPGILLLLGLIGWARGI